MKVTWEVDTPVLNPMGAERVTVREGGYAVALVYGSKSGEAVKRATVIAACPTMLKKLADTVAWLDREIEGREDSLRGILVEVEISSLIELRDDLAETLRKIEASE